MPRTAVVLLSGGLDSAVAAACFRGEPAQSLALCLFFDYGQRAADREARASQHLAQRWQVPWQRLELPWLAELARSVGCRLLAGTGALPAGTIEQPGDDASARAVWVPARNAVFVTVAAAHAEATGAACVVAGFNREEARTFADNSAAFMAAANSMLALGTRNAAVVVSPTIGMDKAGIVAEARRLGLSAADVWSCYEGGEQPCGRCESCLRSRFDR